MGFLLSKSWQWHLSDIWDRGPEAVFEKSRSIYQRGLHFLSGAAVNLAFQIIVPFRKIVIFGIYTDRVGHLTLEPQLGALFKAAISRERADTSIGRPFFLWLGGRTVANELLSQLWRRSGVSIVSSAKLGITMHNPYIMRSRFIESPNLWQQSVVDSCLQNPSSPLRLSDREQWEAKAELLELGVPDSARWICLLNRDQMYLNESLEGDWAYHSYRNSRIGTYQLAAEALADRGYYVLRMGRIVEEQLVSNNPRVIDYANSARKSELLDVYLSMNCEMFISSGTGVDALAILASRPIVFVNFVPFPAGLNVWLTYNSELIALPKHYVRRDGQPWDLREILENDLGGLTHTSDYASAGIVLVDNSSQEIKKVCLEALTRFTGSSVLKPEDSKEQTMFWLTCREYLPEFNRRVPNVNVGHNFLSSNPQWLR